MKTTKIIVVFDADYNDRLTLDPHDRNGLPMHVASWMSNLGLDEEDADYYCLREPVVYASLADLQADVAAGHNGMEGL